MVPKAGLEPARVSPLPPQDGEREILGTVGKQKDINNLSRYNQLPISRNRRKRGEIERYYFVFVDHPLTNVI
jgi:hypothetical protein